MAARYRQLKEEEAIPLLQTAAHILPEWGTKGVDETKVNKVTTSVKKQLRRIRESMSKIVEGWRKQEKQVCGRVKNREDEISRVRGVMAAWDTGTREQQRKRQERMSFVVGHEVWGGRWYVDEVYTAKGWRGRGVARAMMGRLTGGKQMELMVRRRDRKGEEAEAEPWKAYEKMGMKTGRLGAAGEMGYAGVKGCQYMRGTIPSRNKQEEEEAWGKVAMTDMIYKGEIEGGMGRDIRGMIMRAHGIGEVDARHNVEGGKRRCIMVVHATKEPGERGEEEEEERRGEGNEREGEVGRRGGEEGRREEGEADEEGAEGWTVVKRRRGRQERANERAQEERHGGGGQQRAGNRMHGERAVAREEEQSETSHRYNTVETQEPGGIRRIVEADGTEGDEDDEEGTQMLRRWMQEVEQRRRMGKGSRQSREAQQTSSMATPARHGTGSQRADPGGSSHDGTEARKGS